VTAPRGSTIFLGSFLEPDLGNERVRIGLKQVHACIICFLIHSNGLAVYLGLKLNSFYSLSISPGVLRAYPGTFLALSEEKNAATSTCAVRKRTEESEGKAPLGVFT
jgi:hypothetical protein